MSLVAETQIEPELVTTAREAAVAAEALLADATRAVRNRVTLEGRVSGHL